jgi:hypothetical protein
MQTTAQAWLALRPSKPGILLSRQFLPVMLLGRFGGVMADCLPERKTLAATQTWLMIRVVSFDILVAKGRHQAVAYFYAHCHSGTDRRD